MRLEAVRRWWDGLDRYSRMAVAVWVAIVLVVCCRAVVIPREKSVYPIFADAGRHWLAGETLYRPAGDSYRYSPLVAALLVPLGTLPDGVGGVVWRLSSAAVLLGALAWWIRCVLPDSLTGSQRALLFLLVAPLAAGNLNNGQSNPLILGLLLAAVTGAATERWNLASVCVALACLFKVYPIAVGLLLAVVYPRRFAGRLVAALALGVALPFLLQHPAYVTEQYATWLHHMQADDRQVFARELWYRDLRLLCDICGVPLRGGAYAAVQLTAAGGIAIHCMLAGRAAWPPRRLLVSLLALACCWMTLLGSAAESATYILLAPSIAWAVLEAWQRPRPTWVRGVLLASYGLLLAAQIMGWFPIGRHFHALGPQPLAALLLVTVLVVEAVRSLAKGLPAGEPSPEQVPACAV